MRRTVLVLNSGSSSLKFAVVDPASGLRGGRRDRRADRRGRGSGTTGRRLRIVVDRRRRGVRGARAGRPTWHLGCAVGHRVVHGGKAFYRPTLITDAVVDDCEELSPLAPLHNPANLARHRVARNLLPDLPRSPCSTPRSSMICPRPRHLRDRPRGSASTGIATLRLPRHVPPVRHRAGARCSWGDRWSPEPDRAAPGQRRLGICDRRRPRGGHLDGSDPAGGPGDGHPLRRHRPRRDLATCCAPPSGVDAIDDDAEPPHRRARVCAARSISAMCMPDRIRRSCRAWPTTSTSTGCASISAPIWRCWAAWT